MTGNKKKLFTMLLAVLVLLPVLSTAVFAANSDEKSFSIDVDMKVPGSDTVYDTQIYLYKAAEAQMDKNGNLHMEPAELFQDLEFDSLTPEKARTLLEEVCKRVKYPGSASEPGADFAPLAVKKPGKDGMIHFDQLDAGMYLLLKWNQEEPKKLEMLPALVCLPGVDPKTGEWQHTAAVSPKFSWQPDPTPAPAPTPAPSDSNPKLPQTGMVQWPVPVLLIAGLALLVIGYGVLRRAKQD